MVSLNPISQVKSNSQFPLRDAPTGWNYGLMEVFLLLNTTSTILKNRNWPFKPNCCITALCRERRKHRLRSKPREVRNLYAWKLFVPSLQQISAIKTPLRIDQGWEYYLRVHVRMEKKRHVKGDVTRVRLSSVVHQENQKCYKIICLCQRYDAR